MCLTSTAAVKAFHSNDVAHVKALCFPVVWAIGISRRSSDTTVLAVRSHLLHGTRSAARRGVCVSVVKGFEGEGDVVSSVLVR